MPGTIHVSVLELVGLPSSPQSSSMCIKVSMGKQAHDMQDKEETSFPLATLRDNLNVSIHDSEGNEITHTDVESRSIVEKVMWDDFFPLKGGGNIHMKLHFILTEDEQNRIRSMRESATRKKHEDLMRRRHSTSDADLAGASGGSFASSYDALKYRYKTEGRSLDFSRAQADRITSEPAVESLNKTRPVQKTQAFSASKSTGSLDELLDFQHSKGRIQGQDALQQNQLDKTPSNEESPATNRTWATTQLSSSTTADIPPKPPSLKKAVVNSQSDLSELEKPRAPSTAEEKEKEIGDSLPSDNTTKELARLRSDSKVDTRSNVAVLQKTVTVNSEISDEKNISEAQLTKEEYQENSLKQLHISPLSNGNMSSFKKILQGLPRRKRSFTNFLSGKEGITTSDSFVIDKMWRSKRWRPCQRKSKPDIHHKNEYCSSDSWIFMDEMITSCVLSDDRPFVDVQDGCLANCNRDVDQEKLTDDTNVTQSKSEKDSKGSNEWESNKKWPNNISFPRPAGQVVKIAIMAGFGLLVFFTRQRK